MQQNSFKIYAYTDSHQDARKECTLLSAIINGAKSYRDTLILNCGDFYKGIYDPDFEVKNLLKFKKLCPAKVIFTPGNNDFGFNYSDMEYFKNAVIELKKAGIECVSLNLFKSDTNERPDWIKSYTTTEYAGKKVLVTGLCKSDSINNADCSVYLKKPDEVKGDFKKIIETEKPDFTIILNHDYYNSCLELKKIFPKISLIIGGHDHSPVMPDDNNKIYYPQAFCGSMYKFEVKGSEIEKYEEISVNDLNILPCFENDLMKYEKETNLFYPIAKRVLNLPKKYSDPSPLGSFFADAAKTMLKADAACISTGFLTSHILYKENSYITKYDFLHTMPAKTPVKTVLLDCDQIFKMFGNALEDRTIRTKTNSKFLQCSNNIKIKGRGKHGKNYTIEEIYIDNEPVSKSVKKYLIAVDSFIASGAKGYDMLKTATVRTSDFTIDEILISALKEAQSKYIEGETYPEFTIEETIIY